MNYLTALVHLPLVRESTGERIRTPADVMRVCSDIANLAQETFHILMLNAKNLLINRHMVTIGLANAAPVHPREVFRPAIDSGAVAVVLVHNHPSGESEPSAEDARITKQLIEAGKILDINVLDHVIIGRPTAASNGFFSMRESGICGFTESP